MDTLRIDIAYRPLRFAWAIQSDDFASFRSAVRTSFAFWGGRFNPILLVDHEAEARRLVSLFRVDLIWPIGDSESVKAFPDKFPHLHNPFLHDELFIGDGHGKRSEILDVQNMLAYHADRPEWRALRDRGVRVYDWDPGDHLADVLLVHFGGFPDPQETGTDYRALLVQASAATTHKFQPAGSLPADSMEHPSIPPISRFGLDRHYALDARPDAPGFFMGDVTHLEDLVYHWNLRAADVPLLFVDPAHITRYAEIIPAWDRLMREMVAPRHEFDREVAVWTRPEALEQVGGVFSGLTLMRHPVTEDIWNGLNLRVPMMHFGESSTLGVISRGSDESRVSFALGDKPFSGDPWFFSQHLVASVASGIGIYGDDNHTLSPPYVPELNEFCSRGMRFQPDTLRVEPGRLGLVIDAADKDAFLNALPVGDLMERIFGLAGYRAKLSGAGLIVRQLISRLGGLQGARVFKIPGVRRLLRTHGPLATFTRKGALDLIGATDPDDPTARFTDHARLYIEQRPDGDLQPSSVFSFMVEKGLFRIGADLTCPHCRMASWTALDALTQRVTCELCGSAFDATRQLVDGHWHYRRSGIMGAERNAQGAVPVALTLQQLDANLFGHRGESMYSPSLDLVPADGVDLPTCEVDFVWVDSRPHKQRTAIILGECKDRGPIPPDEFRRDVENLRRVSDALPRDRFKTFVLLAKLAPFTPEEIDAARVLNDEYRLRAILLTAQELEPYHIYERVQPDARARMHDGTPEDLAAATFQQYFRPLGDSAKIGLSA